MYHLDQKKFWQRFIAINKFNEARHPTYLIPPVDTWHHLRPSLQFIFLIACTHLYNRVCPSVRPDFVPTHGKWAKPTGKQFKIHRNGQNHSNYLPLSKFQTRQNVLRIVPKCPQMSPNVPKCPQMSLIVQFRIIVVRMDLFTCEDRATLFSTHNVNAAEQCNSWQTTQHFTVLNGTRWNSMGWDGVLTVCPETVSVWCLPRWYNRLRFRFYVITVT